MIRSTLFALFLAASACHASIDPAMQASIDQQVAALRPQATTYPAPTSDMPPPLASGQWIRLKLVDADKRPAFATYEVLDQVGSAFWIEVVSDSYSGRSIIKILADFGDRTDPAKVDIQGLVVKTRDHAPIDYTNQGPVLALVKGTYKSVLNNLIIHWQGLPRETKGAIGGTFTDCFKGTSEVTLLGVTRRGTVWSHPAVPINGAVAFVGDEGDSQEIVAFGMSGAVSEL